MYTKWFLFTYVYTADWVINLFISPYLGSSRTPTHSFSSCFFPVPTDLPTPAPWLLSILSTNMPLAIYPPLQIGLSICNVFSVSLERFPCLSTSDCLIYPWNSSVTSAVSLVTCWFVCRLVFPNKYESFDEIVHFFCSFFVRPLYLFFLKYKFIYVN